MCHLFPDLPLKQLCIHIPTDCAQAHKPGWMMLMDVYVSLDTIEPELYFRSSGVMIGLSETLWKLTHESVHPQ